MSARDVLNSPWYKPFVWSSVSAAPPEFAITAGSATGATACPFGDAQFGALLTLIGIPLTFSRLLRRGAAGSNEPEPPTVHPQKPGELGVQFNMAYMRSRVRGLVENFDVINGIILLEVGTLLWGIAATIMSGVWPPIL